MSANVVWLNLILNDWHRLVLKDDVELPQINMLHESIDDFVEGVSVVKQDICDVSIPNPSKVLNIHVIGDDYVKPKKGFIFVAITKYFHPYEHILPLSGEVK